MKILATEREAKLTYLKREMVKLSNSAWWPYKDDHPDHPKVQTLIRTRDKILTEIKELEVGKPSFESKVQ